MAALTPPPRIFPSLLMLLALPLLWWGFKLILLGGSLYYVFAGTMLASCAIYLWQRRIVALHIYSTLVLSTIIWSLCEVGTNLWALAPRVLPFAMLGIWLLTPWARTGFYIEPKPLFVPANKKQALILLAAACMSLGYLIYSHLDTEVLTLSPRSGVSSANTRTDWPNYGNTSAGTRYSPLEQIHTESVDELEVAWVYRTGQGGTFKATPIQIGQLLYFCTGGNVVIALDAETGQSKWQFDPEVDIEHLSSPLRYFTTSCRGVSYYQAPPEYKGECPQRIITATTDARMIALNALNGKLCSQFGNAGQISLSTHMGNDPLHYNFQTSPPGIVRGKAVIGGWVFDNQSVNEPSGVVRAFDAITGEFAWAWDMGRPGIHTEPLPNEDYTRSTPNVWSLFSVDEELGLIYAPTGNETPDYFGGQRQAVSEQYASSVVAIDADTGSVRWAFQTVHHDLWDYDVASQPTLIDLPNENGELIPALIQPTKRSEIFVLNRITGEPIFDIQELPVPQEGGIPEDYTSNTQPFALDMPHFRPDLSESKMWGISPYDQLWCRIQFKKMRYHGHFTAPTNGTILQFPGNAGGYNWGGISVDEVNHIMIVNPLLMASQLSLYSRDALPEGYQSLQIGTPYSNYTRFFMSPLGIPCQQPPYGMIAAIDLETKQLLWQRPIGSAKDSRAFGIRARLPFTIGTPLTGGTLTTAGGLTFLAGTFDNTIRALSVRDGKELWQHPLPYSATSTPMSYLSPKGSQMIVITVPVFNTTGTGGPQTLQPEDEDPQGGYVIAYKLPN